MPDTVGPGPQNPSRIIFVATAVIASAVGLATGEMMAFLLAFLGSVALLCTGYALIRRHLGWKPLNVDDLLNLVGIMHP